MHITQHTDYALRVLIYLAAHTQRRPTVQEIAQRFGISRHHLMKVVNRLIHTGFVHGVRGKGGGLLLAAPATQIRIGQVVRQMEGELALVECFTSSSQCLLTPGCQLKGAFEQALEAFLNSLDKVSLSDVLGSAQGKTWQVLKLHTATATHPNIKSIHS